MRSNQISRIFIGSTIIMGLSVGACGEDGDRCDGIAHGHDIEEAVRYETSSPAFGVPCVAVAQQGALVCNDGEAEWQADFASDTPAPFETCEELLTLTNIGDAQGTLGDQTLADSNGLFSSSDSGITLNSEAPDNLAFWHESITGNFEVTLRGSGLMIRESLSTKARFVAYSNHLNQTARAAISRKDVGGQAVLESGADADENDWYRIKRIGDSIVTFASSNGTNWQEDLTIELANLSETIFVGVFVTSGDKNETSHVQLSDYAVIGL